MRKGILCFVMGALIFGTIGAYAGSYVADPAGFKVFVNGNEFISDPPALVVEGRTYLPLRAMGDALNIPVKWNEESGQVEVGSSVEGTGTEEETYTNEDKPTKATDQYYTENSNVPNLGYVLNKDATKNEVRNGSNVYYYDVSNEEDGISPIRQYEYILKQSGYTVSVSNNKLTATHKSSLTLVIAEQIGKTVYVIF